MIPVCICGHSSTVHSRVPGTTMSMVCGGALGCRCTNFIDASSPNGAGRNLTAKAVREENPTAEIILVVVPLASLATLSEDQILSRVEYDLTLEADEVLVQRDGGGRYQVVKSRINPESVGHHLLSSEDQKEQLLALRDKLAR